MSQSFGWFEISKNIKIENLGRIQAVNRHPMRNDSSCWVLVLVGKGKRTLYVNGKKMCVGAGEFFLLPPHTKQEPCEIDDHIACYVHFIANGKAAPAPKMIDDTTLTLPTHGYLPPAPDCFSYMEYLCDHSMNPFSSMEFLNEQFRSLLTVMAVHCKKNPIFLHNRSAVESEEVLDFIKANADTSLKAKDFEERFGLSYHQINLMFKRRFECTLKQYQFRIRMESAAKMLIHGMAVGETASACGYFDYYYFIKCFTKFHGISPSEYRKRYLI